jgi:nucleoside phosphorylase/CheY-like chemotaxis protein
MNILLLEDNSEKTKKIKDAILENKKIKEDNITTVVSTREARILLYENEYDLFISDLLVPENFGDEPNAEESIQLLYDISNDDEINQPLHIIGITAYEDKIEEYKKYFLSDDWHLMSYNESTYNWEDILKKKIDYILNSKNNISNNQFKYDIGIICALNDPEFKQILKLSKDWKTVNNINSSIEFYETVFKRDSKELSVIAVSINQMGMVSTSILATQMIELFRPKYLTMTGIAAGIPGKTELGEVLVIEYSWDYNSGKIKTDADGHKKFEVDMRQESLDRDLYNNMNVLKNDAIFLNELHTKYEGTKPKTYLEISIGHVASGAAVIANEDITNEVTEQARKLKGIEMEAYGLICAANHATSPKPKPLVIKSVCDFANKDKNDDIQDYAAYTSAQVLYEFALRYF